MILRKYGLFIATGITLKNPIPFKKIEDGVVIELNGEWLLTLLVRSKRKFRILCAIHSPHIEKIKDFDDIRPQLFEIIHMICECRRQTGAENRNQIKLWLERNETKKEFKDYLT